MFLLGDSIPFSTLVPTKPLTVISIQSWSSGTVAKLSVIKAVPFKGTESEDFLLWLQNYEQMSRVNGWSEDYKVVHIATVLQEDANRQYWEYSHLARSTWVLLKKALKQKFNPESSRATFEAALESRKRKPNETLDKYMSELWSLARKAFPDWDTTYRNKLVQIHFIDGLEENLRIWVLQSNPKT